MGYHVYTEKLSKSMVNKIKNYSNLYVITKSSCLVYKDANLNNMVANIKSGTAMKVSKVTYVNSNTIKIKITVNNKYRSVYLKYAQNIVYLGYDGSSNPISGHSTSYKNATPLNNAAGNINTDRVLKDYENFTTEAKKDNEKKDNATEAQENASAAATTNSNSTSSTSSSNSGGYSTDPANTKLQGNFYPINWSETNSSLRNNDYYNVSNVGLTLDKLRGIFGLPYQFLTTTDCRVNFENQTENEDIQNQGNFGVTYGDKIASRMPLLYMTPCNTNFMASTNAKARESLMGDVISWGASNDNDNLSRLTEDYSGKLYSTQPAFAEYFKYVNPMCRTCAIMLGLNKGLVGENEKVYPDEYYKIDGIDIENYNWSMNKGSEYTMYEEPEEEEEEKDDTKTDEEKKEEKKPEYVSDFVQSTGLKEFQSMIYYNSCIPFYINSETSFSETITNETTESSIASFVNGLSDKAREIQFILGTGKAALGEAIDAAQEALAASREAVDRMVKNLDNGNNIFGTLWNSFKSIVTGGRMMFPNIWLNSSFSRNYEINIKLTTPSFDKRSWYLNIAVPLCHLLGFVLPRGEYPNTYNSPFLVKAFYKGMFNIDMGLITNMSIKKGKEGGWTRDGLPTVVDVSFTITDLYQALSMTPEGDFYVGHTLQNISEMDYLANLCGVNINEPDTFRMIAMYETFQLENRFLDIPQNISNQFSNFISNKLSNAYTNFWY